MDNKKLTQWGIGVVLLIIFFGSSIIDILTRYIWIDNIGFKGIFLTQLKASIALFGVTAIVFMIFASINLFISSKLTKSKTMFKEKWKYGILAIISVFIGISNVKNWMLVLKYLNQSTFGILDPIFSKDVSFYVFSLPFFMYVANFMIVAILLTIIIVLGNYFQTLITAWIKKSKELKENPLGENVNYKKYIALLGNTAKIHIALLLSLFFVLISVKNYFDRFKIMYSEAGIVVGAGYTDTMVLLPAIKLIMILSIVVAVIFIAWAFSKGIKKRHILGITIIGYIAISIVATTVVPGIIQSLKVSPNEINLEKPYIENNIKYTKMAYGLDDVEEIEFSADKKLTTDIITEQSAIIDNIRLLDWRPLTSTYKQTQEIRLYYDLSGIDIDRYYIDGEYREVMLAARELDQNKILTNAKTWVNLHQIYTHGNGVVMSPVNEVTSEGLPEYLIKDIPPVSKIGLPITNPRIYYGEKSDNFVIVNTETKEFDYPKGDTNMYNQYDGTGGIKLDKFYKKLLLAFYFRDIKILLSGDMTKESRIMFDRNIQDRISLIAPFLWLDNDPYIVINDGRLFWIQDAYTVTDKYPYSEKYWGINYIRNSVKIVVDAYNGDVSYYVVDEKDPIINTYSTIFPNAFKSFEDMPEGLKNHTRYPEDLFKLQSDVFSIYHMNDPTVFYNKEDAWQIPNEIYGVGQQIKSEPYYIIMKLPGQVKEEFILMTSFTPIRKDNMVAWFAARSDEEYGKLILFKLSKDKLIPGPSQIEAMFDQDSEISQQLTLWSQQGSQVARGNLLVIPIKDSMLYIEPLYIQAENGQLPQMKRVLVSDGEKVIMEKDLDTALRALLVKGNRTSVTTGDDSEDELIKKASQYYNLIQDAMQDGDWEKIGNNFNNLGEVLEQLSEEENPNVVIVRP